MNDLFKAIDNKQKQKLPAEESDFDCPKCGKK